MPAPHHLPAPLLAQREKQTRSLRRQGAFGLAAATLGAVLATGMVLPPASAAIVDAPITASSDTATLQLNPLGSYETGTFDASAAEVVTYHADSQRLFVVNAAAGGIDVLDISAPDDPKKVAALAAAGVELADGSIIPAGTAANGVAVRPDGLGAIAIEAPNKTDAGWLVFFDANAVAAAGALTDGVLGAVTVGAQPDMVTFAPDGSTVVSANEGEPNDAFTIDPEGSVSVVTAPDTVTAPIQADVATADFHAFEAGGSKTLHSDVRIFGPDVLEGRESPTNRVSANLEPEYVAIDAASEFGYVALQEANAVAVVDLATAEVTEIWPLGFQDHSLPGNGIDASDRDPEDAPTLNIQTYEGLKGMYMPDGINAYTATDSDTLADGTYLVTANEGDAREWGEYKEGTRVKSLEKDGFRPVCATSPLADKLGDADLGRLNVTTENGLNADGTCYEELYSFGSRSFSIWDTAGTQVFDSGDDFEQITAAANPDWFNSNHSESTLESRSEDKGPEPENMAIGEVDGRTYAFIGLERVGGIMVYDITDPAAAHFTTYINNRDFGISMEDSVTAGTGATDLPLAGDLGPEGLAFISAADSATGQPMIAVGNEVSGTTTLFGITSTDAPVPSTVDIQVLGINDFHGRIAENAGNREAGAAVLAGAVNQLKTENPNTVFVSAGDNIGASTFTSFSQQDQPTIDALLAAGLDASVVGNHEFDGGWPDLRDRVTSAYGDPRYALGANVYLAGTDTPALDEYWVTEMAGVSVAFIGTVTEQTASMVSPSGIADIEFGDQLEAANRVAAQLQDGDTGNGEADVIVLLTHEGSASTDCAAIAAEDTLYGDLVRGASPGIDAILSGHTHSVYNCSFPVAGGNPAVERAVLQSGQYGMNLDQLSFTIDTSDNSVVSLQSAVLPLHDGTAGLYPADAAVAAIVADAQIAADEAGSVNVGAISADITRAAGGADRGSESSLSNLLADIQLWATSNADFGGTPADIAVMNPGGVRADLLYGTDGQVTYKDVADVQPFANTLVTVDLTGEQLRQLLEQQWQPDGSSRAKLHLGISEGFSYVYEPAAARGERILSMTLNDVPIVSTQVYTVATNSFLAAGGDNFTVFADGANPTDTGQIDLAATVAYFEQFSLVEPASLGRAVLASAVIENPEAVDPEAVDPEAVAPEAVAPETATPKTVPAGTGTGIGVGVGVASSSSTGIMTGEVIAAGSMSSSRDALADTGAAAAPTALLAALLLFLGTGLLVARRRRSTLVK